MENKVKSYETIFVADVTKGDEVVKSVIDRFTSLIASNGEITQVNDWGKRRLAYPINDRTEGYYTLVYFKADPSFASELERLYNINENILRSIVVKEDEKVKHLAADAPAAEVVEDEDDEPAAPAVVEAVAEAAEEVEEAAEEVTEEAAEEVAEAAEAVAEEAEAAAEDAE